MGTCCDAYDKLESSFHPCEFTAIVPEPYPWETKMCLKLIAKTDARSVGDSHPSCKSVCLSVRHTLVLCRNGSTYRQTVFTAW